MGFGVKGVLLCILLLGQFASASPVPACDAQVLRTYEVTDREGQRIPGKVEWLYGKLWFVPQNDQWILLARESGWVENVWVNDNHIQLPFVQITTKSVSPK